MDRLMSQETLTGCWNSPGKTVFQESKAAQYMPNEHFEHLSHNYGVEGETADAGIDAVRKRQVMNFFLTLLVSRGVPMLLGGDEFRRTQNGNNNAWCQDNETSWFNWTCLERHGEIQQFVRDMIAFRRAHPALSKENFYTESEIQWLNSAGGSPNWADPNEKALACVIQESENSMLLMIFNADVSSALFHLPPLPQALTWRLAVDTAHLPRQGLLPDGDELPMDNPKAYCVEARSSVIFLAQKGGGRC
jgi:isoamylase